MTPHWPFLTLPTPEHHWITAKMKTFKTISALAALLQPAVANLDVVTLFAKADAYIQEASATLVLGDVPLSNNGDVALWSAIMMQNEASFLQGVTQNSPEG